MAPALTDAAAHPRSCKLPVSPMNPENNNSLRANPGSPSDPGIGLGGGEILTRTLALDSAQIIKGATTLETFHRVVNGNGKHLVSDKRISLNGKNGGSKLILTNGNSNHHSILKKISIDLTPLSNSNTIPTSSIATSLLKKIDLPTRLNGHSNENKATMPPETTTILDRLRCTKNEVNSQELERNGHISTNTRILDIDVENMNTEISISVRDDDVEEDSSDIPIITTAEDPEPIDVQCDINEEKEIKLDAKRTDSLKRQKKLEHQAIILMKRIRRIQSRQISSHVKKQIGDAIDHEHKLHELVKESIEDETSSERLLLDGDTLDDVSSKDTKVNSRLLPGSTSGSLDHEGSPRITEEFTKPKPSDIQVVIGNLNANLQHLENSIDSDATESSSGGETDEDDEEDDDASKSLLKLHKVPLHQRSLWRWAKARSAIASRWTWLQAQVSDLEYRIRQQNDIHRQIRSTKGAVTLGEPPSAEEILRIKTVNSNYKPGKKLSPIEAKIARLEGKNELSPSNISTLLCNVDRQSAKLQKSFQNCVSPILGTPTSHHATNGGDKVHPNRTTINGTKTNLETPNNQHKRIRLETSTPSPMPYTLQIPIEEKYCARTRPVKYYRKRRIVRSVGMHYLSRKASKRSTVKCRCCQPQMPCVMCGGRYNNLKPFDTNFMPEKERLSLLDYSYHPVLSFKKDVPATIRLETLISNGDWQRRANSKAQNRKKSRLSSRDKKAKRKLNKSSSFLFASKLRELKQLKKESKMMLSRSHSQPTTPKGLMDISRQCRTDIKNKRAAQLAIAALKKRARSLSLPEINCKPQSGATTPTTDGQGLNSLFNSMPTNSLNSIRRKFIANDAYDIDNIVIPYSILASTRVEKLNYKEIVTPKWRMVTDDEVLNRNRLLQDAADHLSDEDDQQSFEAIQLRHKKSEILEKSLYIKAVTDLAHLNLKRSHSRRSRTNSATSPDPIPDSPDMMMSETQMADTLNASSSSASLPASETVTPSPSPSPVTISDSCVLDRNLEKRRISNNSESTVEFEEEIVMVDPWPLRTFPLTEEETRDLESENPIVYQEPDVAKSSGVSTPKSSVTLSRAGSDVSSDDDLNEDPNDPEWTVVMKQKKVEVTPKGSIVLKLARR